MFLSSRALAAPDRPSRPQSILETLFQRSRSTYLHSRYGTHPEFPLVEDEVCKMALRTGALLPPVRTPGPVGGESELLSFPVDDTHPALVRAYEEATSTVPPPNDPILMPGQFHLGPSSSGQNGGAHRNGASPSTGFGVSAERSGCQNDGYGSMANMNVGMPTAGFAAVAAGVQPQNFKWLSAEYSDNSWMTWF